MGLVLVEGVHRLPSLGLGHKFQSRSGGTRSTWPGKYGQSYTTWDEIQSVTIFNGDGDNGRAVRTSRRVEHRETH